MLPLALLGALALHPAAHADAPAAPAAAAASAGPAAAAGHHAHHAGHKPAGGTVFATLYAVNPGGERRSIGTISFRDSQNGLIVEPRLAGLDAGPHAAHVHERPSCAASEATPGEKVAAGGAGDHYDPDRTNVHAGPYGAGHRGDLPNLTIEADGGATIPVLAPRLTTSELRGRALIIHAGADRYGDHAAHQHGSGGARAYCGLIE
jgi:Cu-Zn family superoxide dismutase